MERNWTTRIGGAAGGRGLALARALAARPLTAGELAVAAAALAAAATFYCILYCRIAFPMHGADMPLRLSVAWAVHSILPWLLALEAWKRGHGLSRSAAASLLLAGAAVGAAALGAVGLERMLDALLGVDNTRAVPLRVAAQLPALLATLALMAAIALRDRASAGESKAAEPGLLLPPPGEIDWIEAAGNYVEIHCGTRTLLHRATMRQIERLLDPRRFVRIHRSTIVNRERIAAITGSPSRTLVTLRDGSRLRVGDAFRRNLRR